MATTAQILANRENASHSTGPVTEAGKTVTGKNALRHGLASSAMLIEGEKLEIFQALENALIEEHQPATPTEMLLVRNMAKHQWLADRAVCFQNVAIERSFFDAAELPKGFSVLIRYQTTNERGFQKALATLRSLRKESPKPEIGSVSQTAQMTATAAAARATQDLLAYVMSPMPGEDATHKYGFHPVTNEFELQEV